jgi:hypothetical protein
MAIVRLELQVDDKGTTKVKQLGEELKKTGEEAKHAHEGMSAIFQGIGIEAGMKIFEALHAAVEALPEFIMSATEHVAELAHELELLQARTGMSTDYLQKLRFMAAATGVDMGAVASAVNKFQKGIEEGSPKVVAALGKLGLSLQQLGKMTADQQFQTVIDRIGKIEQPALRSQIAIALLGKSGAALLPLILNAGDLGKRFEELGIKLDETAVKAGAQLGGEMKLLTAVFEGFKNQIGSVITTSPALHAMLQGVIQLVGQMATWVGKNRAELTSLVDQGLIYMVHGLGMVVEGIGAFVYAIGRSITLYYEAKAGALGFVSALYDLYAALERKTGFTERANEMDRAAVAMQKNANAAKAAGQSWAEATEKANEKVDVVSKALHTMGVAMEDAHDKGMKFKGTEDAVAAGAGEDAKAAEAAAKWWDELAKSEAEATKKQTEHIQALQASIVAGGAEAQKAQDLAVAFETLEDKTQASNEGLAQITKTLSDVAMAGSATELQAMALADAYRLQDERLSQMSQGSLQQLVQRLRMQEAQGFATTESMTLLDDAIQELGTRGTDFRPLLEAMDALQQKAELARQKMAIFETVLGNILGGVGDLADMLGLQNVVDGLQAATDWCTKWDEAIVNGQLDLTKIPGLIRGIVDGFKKATDSANAFSRALGGAMFGAQIGAKIGGAIAGPIGQAIGAAGGAIIGAVAGIFHKPEWAKVADEAGKVLGTHISKALAEEIMKTSKDLHISIDASALLHLTDAIKESGKAATTFFPQMQQLLAGVAHGTIPAAQGVEALGSAFELLQKEAEAGSVAAQQQMVALIQQARAAGVQVPQIVAAVSKAMEDALSGLADFTKNFKITSPEDARAEALIFASTFWAEVKEKGEVAAATAMLPAWQAMQDSLKQAGIDPAVVAEILAPLQGVFDALADEGIKKVIDGLDGASRAVKGLADAGYMTQGAFQGLEQVAGSSVDQLAQDLINKGVPAADAQRQALQLCAPQLAQLSQLSQQYGIKLDANTQSLIDQAAAAGIAFPADPLLLMVSLLQQIADKLGAIPRDTQANVNIHTNYTRSGTPPPGGGGEGGGEEDGTLSTGEGKGAGWEGAPRAASGLVVEPRLGGTGVVVGEAGSRELIGPVDALARSIGAGLAEGLNAKGGQQGGGTTVVFAPQITAAAGADPAAIKAAVMATYPEFERLLQRRVGGGLVRLQGA